MPQLTQTFAAGRIGIGALSWASPSLAAKVFGLDPSSTQPFVTRLFGARDVALGLAAVDSSPVVRKKAVQLGLLCDVLDVVAGVRGSKEGTLPTAPAVLATGTAAVFVAAGVAMLRENP